MTMIRHGGERSTVIGVALAVELNFLKAKLKKIHDCFEELLKENNRVC